MTEWTDGDGGLNGLGAEEIEVLRPDLEKYADATRRVLRLVDAILGMEDQRSNSGDEHERLMVEHHEMLVQVEALQHNLETARAWISVLQAQVAELQDEASDSYAAVGLRATVHDVVLAAARRALLAHYHPDRAAAEDRVRMGALFASASAAFDRISEERRC